MKMRLLIILFADVIICILLGLLTGTYYDALTMLFVSVFIFIVCIALSCIMIFVKKLKKYTLPMLLNSIMLPCIIFIIFEVSNSCRLHNHFVRYHFDTLEGEYRIRMRKDTNEFYINRTFDGGSEGIVHGTYIRLRDNEYKLNVSYSRSYNDKYNELLIKSDSIRGFNGASYALVQE